jgi:hypothetical protein
VKLANIVYGLLTCVDDGPRNVGPEHVAALISGAVDTLSAPYVPGIRRWNGRAEREEQCAGYVWIHIQASGGGHLRSYTAVVRIDTEAHSRFVDPALALRFGQLLCEAATVARTLNEVMP